MFREDLPSVPPSSGSAPRPVPAASVPPAVETELAEGTLLFEQYQVERVVGKVGSCMLVKVRSGRHGGRWLLKHPDGEGSRQALRRRRLPERGARGHAAPQRAHRVHPRRGPFAFGFAVRRDRGVRGLGAPRHPARSRRAPARASSRHRGAGGTRTVRGSTSRARSRQFESFGALFDARTGGGAVGQGARFRQLRDAPHRSLRASPATLDAGHGGFFGVHPTLGHGGVHRSRALARLEGGDLRRRRVGARRHLVRALARRGAVQRLEHAERR